MKFVIQMNDGSYFAEPQNTSKLTEAKRFDSRWEALIAAAQSKQFAYAKIQYFNPGEPEDPKEQGNGGV